MEFGVQFFPAVGPEQKSAEQYWGDALQLTALAEHLGYSHVRTVEHYFGPYGGYSPTRSSSCRGLAANQASAACHRRGAPGVQPPAQDRGRDRHGRRDLERPARFRLCARVPAARFARFGISATRAARASTRAWSGHAPARGGERHLRGQIPQLRGRHVVAAADAEATGRRFSWRRSARPKSSRKPASRPRIMAIPLGARTCEHAGGSRRVESRRASRPRQGDAGIPHVSSTRIGAGTGLARPSHVEPLISIPSSIAAAALDGCRRFLVPTIQLHRKDPEHLGGKRCIPWSPRLALIGSRRTKFAARSKRYDRRIGGSQFASLQVNFRMIPRRAHQSP